jgi:hypothetical protein
MNKGFFAVGLADVGKLVNGSLSETGAVTNVFPLATMIPARE